MMASAIGSARGPTTPSMMTAVRTLLIVVAAVTVTPGVPGGPSRVWQGRGEGRKGESEKGKCVFHFGRRGRGVGFFRK